VVVIASVARRFIVVFLRAVFESLTKEGRSAAMP
jgi:hypothetical protein